MRIDPPPSVTGAAVSLRALDARDVDAWFAYLSVPANVWHSSWAVDDRALLASLVAECESDERDSPIRFAIVDEAAGRHLRDERNERGRLLGTIGLPAISWRHRTAEVAYDLAPESAGRGVATACCRAVTEWALRDLGFVRVQATALESNVASIRVLEKCGFAREGLLRNLKTVRGAARDFFLFAKTEADR